MRAPSGQAGAVDPQRSPGSPAVVLTFALGMAGLLTALSASAFAVSLFLSASALAALPMALADRPGASPLRFALLGAGSAVLGLVLVLVPLLGGSVARDGRTVDPPRELDRPVAPAPARSADASLPPS